MLLDEAYISFFWDQVWPFVERVICVVNCSRSGSIQDAEKVRKAWQVLYAALQDRWPVLAKQLAYAAAAWADEVLMNNVWSGQKDWQHQPMQLFYCADVNAGVRFYELYNAVDSEIKLNAIKQCWFRLWLDFGFCGQDAGAQQVSHETAISCLAETPITDSKPTLADDIHASCIGLSRKTCIVILIATITIYLLCYIVLKWSLSGLMQHIVTLYMAGFANETFA